MSSKKKRNPRNAGRKAKYGEPTRPVTFKLPISKVDEIKARVYELLKEYEDDSRQTTDD